PMVSSSDFLITRRKLMRFFSCSATPSATSCASSSGRSISWILRSTFFFVILARSSLSLSTLAPLRPMITPGRAVRMITVTSPPSVLRSMSTRGMPAKPYSFFTASRIFWSSTRRGPKSFFLAYQRERQSSVTPTRKPVGRTFCPTLLLRLLLPARAQANRQVRVVLAVRIRGAASARAPALVPRPVVGLRVVDVQVVHVDRRLRLEHVAGRVADLLLLDRAVGVGDRALEDLVHEERAALVHVLELIERLRDRQVPDAVHHAAHLARRDL